MIKNWNDTPRRKKVFKRLKALYNKIPDTVGCMENIESCKGWCCRLQNPQVLNCEFLYVWSYIMENWDAEQISGLMERCLRSYLSNNFNKSCVFWDSETKLCMTHTRRPFNCHIYGITPNEEIQPRVDALREANKDNLMAQVRDQCDLVSTESGEEVTSSMTSEWWDEMQAIEQELGIKARDINDAPGGSYRTYHDYIIMMLLGNEMMGQLSLLRQHGDQLEKEVFLKKYVEIFKKGLEDKEDE